MSIFRTLKPRGPDPIEPSWMPWQFTSKPASFCLSPNPNSLRRA